MTRIMTRMVGALALLAAAVACSRDHETSQSTKTLAPTVTITRTAPESPAPARSSTPAHENAPPSAKGASATVGKAKLALHGCRLEVAWAGGATTTKDIELPEPCSFVTTRTGPQVVKTDHGQTLLVVSSRRDETTEKDCDTKLRAVVVNGDRVGISREKQEIAMCGADGPFDTILFHTLAASAF